MQLDTLKQLVEESPDDPLPLYGMAMEYRRLEQLEAADDIFRTLRNRFPDYLPQYLMHGQLLEALGRPDAAREAYDRGRDTARAQGEAHAEAELTEAYEALQGQ